MIKINELITTAIARNELGKVICVDKGNYYYVTYDNLIAESGKTPDQSSDFEVNYLSKVNKPTPNALPFTSKVLPNGTKLFRRSIGLRKDIAPNSSDKIILEVPFLCKFNKVEIINCSGNDTVNLKVLDSVDGTYTTVSNYLLSQFGFNVNVCESYYFDESSYDADLMPSMQIEVEYFNNGIDIKNIGVNFILHEVRQ